MSIKSNICIGDIYLMKFNGNEHEQAGWRPGLIFQNNVGNRYSPNVIALPLTSVIKKMHQPTHVFISAADSGLKKDSVVLCENPCCISKGSLGCYITTLSKDYMEQIVEASLLATSAISYLDFDMLKSVYQKALQLNANIVA